MADDWFADVQRYHPAADPAVVKKVVNYLGIALRNRDSSLVSFSDPAEVARVRERFLQKKLALTDSDDVLARGLEAVKDMMDGDRTKNRVTVYYLLADWFGKLDLFGGSSSPAGSFSFASSGAAPVDPTAPKPKAPPEVKAARAAAAPVAAASIGGASTAADGAQPELAYGDSRPANEDAGGGDGGSPSWFKWLIILVAMLLLLWLLRGCMMDGQEAEVVATGDLPTNAAPTQ